MHTVEWQVLRDTENTEESQIEYKTENTGKCESCVFANRNELASECYYFLEYLKVKFVIKSHRLVKLLIKFNKNFM